MNLNFFTLYICCYRRHMVIRLKIALFLLIPIKDFMRYVPYKSTLSKITFKIYFSFDISY